MRPWPFPYYCLHSLILLVLSVYLRFIEYYLSLFHSKINQFLFFLTDRVTFENVVRKQKLGDNAMDEDDEKKIITVEPHVQPKRGPYLYNEPKK